MDTAFERGWSHLQNGALLDAAEGWLRERSASYDQALRWFARRGDAEGEGKLAGALWRYWYLRGHYQEGRSCLERALIGEPGA